MTPDLGGFGRGIGAFEMLDAVVRVDGTHHAAGALGRMDDGLHHECRGGFAFGAGDTHDVERLVGVAVDERRQQRHSGAYALDNESGGTAGNRGEISSSGFFANVCDGAGSKRALQECRAELGALAEEHVARCYGTRIERAACNRHRNVWHGRADKLSGIFENLLQHLHRATDTAVSVFCHGTQPLCKSC